MDAEGANNVVFCIIRGCPGDQVDSSISLGYTAAQSLSFNCCATHISIKTCPPNFFHTKIYFRSGFFQVATTLNRVKGLQFGYLFKRKVVNIVLLIL